MKHQPAQEPVNPSPIFGRPAAPSDETIYLSQRRVEEMDPVDITVPGEEITHPKKPDEDVFDPKKIEPIGNYGNNESPLNIDGANPQPDIDDVDDVGAGDDEDTPHPIMPQTR